MKPVDKEKIKTKRAELRELRKSVDERLVRLELELRCDPLNEDLLNEQKELYEKRAQLEKDINTMGVALGSAIKAHAAYRKLMNLQEHPTEPK